MRKIPLVSLVVILAAGCGDDASMDMDGGTTRPDASTGMDAATGGTDAARDAARPFDTGGDDAGPGSDSGPPLDDYQANLNKILASTFRNTNEDDSPFRFTPSVDLYGEADLYDPYTIYTGGYEGDYGGEFLYEPTYFPGNGAGTFRTSCEVSHFAYDDPSVLPGQPEASHLQMFIGNTHANAYSTYETIMNEGGGTCNGGELNRTAYWVPAVFDGRGNIVVPSLIKFYYKTEMAPGVGNVQTYPENLQLVADRRNNIDGNRDMATFRCNTVWNGGKHNPSNNIPYCRFDDQAGAVEMMIYFDYCWNGVEESVGDWSRNSAENFAAPNNYWHSSVCPASHPILLPALATHIFFDLMPGEDTSQWYLSSDIDPATGELRGERGASAHAGWFGGWNREINQEFVDNCNNRFGECGSGMLGDPQRDGDVRALRRRTDWVTGVHRIPVSDVYEQLCTASDERPFDEANGGARGAHCRPAE